VLKVIYEACAFKNSNQKVYLIHRYKIGVVSERHSFITKAVVNFLASYYKSNYPGKWGKIFSDEDTFFTHIS
jgi:hypothetical protein